MKKSQGSLELIILFVFLLTVVSLIIYSLSFLLLDLKDNEINFERNDFAQSIIAEAEMLQRVRGTYKREVKIEEFLLKRFDINVSQGVLILQDFEANPFENKSYYYELPGNQTTYMIEEDRDNNGFIELYIVFEKDYNNEFKGLNP